MIRFLSHVLEVKTVLLVSLLRTMDLFEAYRYIVNLMAKVNVKRFSFRNLTILRKITSIDHSYNEFAGDFHMVLYNL